MKNKPVKNITLSHEDITNLLLTMDQFSMINKSIEISLDELITNYKREYIKDNYYTSYYEFLTDKIEELALN